MAASVQALDEILKEYLLFRGFTSTLKAFDAELKSDRDKSFRVNKIVQQLMSFVLDYDLQGIRDYWSYLRRRFFSRLDSAHLVNAQKLEKCLYRFYLVNAVQTSRPDRVSDFFEKMAPELQNHVDWKEWFALPFLKSPEQNPSLEMYFSQLWQETFPLSLHNFLNAIFQTMPLPRLLKFDAERIICEKLRQDNSHLHQKIVSLQQEIALLQGDKERKTIQKDSGIHPRMDKPKVVKPKEKEMNFIQRKFRLSKNKEQQDEEPKISSVQDQETKITEKFQPQQQQQENTYNAPQMNRDFDEIPRLTKKSNSDSHLEELGKTPPNMEDGKGEIDKSDNYDIFRNSGSVNVSEDKDPLSLTSQLNDFEQPREKRSFSLSTKLSPRRIAPRRALSTITSNDSIYKELVTMNSYGENLSKEGDITKPFIMLGEGTFSEHRSAVVQCDFSPSGKLVASVDSDGIVKVWKHQPDISTVATVMSKSSLLSAEWASKSDKVLLLGTSNGKIRLYDTETKTTRFDVSTDSQYSRVVSLACSPSGASFVCSATVDSKSKTVRNSDASQGTLLLWDLKTMKLERHLPLGSSGTRINYIAYNHNGTLLVTGGADGMIRIYDTRSYACLMSWTAHSGPVTCVQFSVDETSVFSMGCDNQFLQWSLRKMGLKTATLATHEGMSGPHDGALLGRTKQTMFSRLFTFDCVGEFLLTCSPISGVIYKYNQSDNSLAQVFSVGEHKTHVTSVDWSSAGAFTTCLTGSLDGHIRVTTLLKQ